MGISFSVKEVKKAFKGNAVLKDITLEAKGSEIIGLVGKSGCGKSTLLKILVGYYKPDSGEIFLNKEKLSGNVLKLRKLVGYTTQENSFYEKLSVIENMRYYANIYNVKNREKRIKYLLQQVELFKHKDKLAENISGGMKRRLDFAISLVHNPSILILDEPTAGLDPLLIDQFWKIVQTVVFKEKKIAVMASHILPEIEKYCTKAAVIEKGIVVKVFDKKEMENLESKFRALVK